MPEKRLQIDIGDGLVMPAVHREVGGAPTVILVHGLAGHANEHLHFNAARRFEAAGYSTLRISLYGVSRNNRKLIDCDVSTHARDIDTAIRFLRARSDAPVAIVGHSLGGLSSLLTTEPFEVLVLWDATHARTVYIHDHIEWLDDLQVFRWRGDVDKLLGKSMIDDLRELDSEMLLAERREPVLVVACSEGDRALRGEQHFEAANEPKKFVAVPESDHVFSFGDTAQHVYDETLSWLDAHLRK